MRTKFLILFLSLTSVLSAAEQPWAVTFDGLYAKPFRSEGYIGRTTDGYGLNASLEYKENRWLGMGVTARGLGFREGGASSSFSGLDLFGRIAPFVNAKTLQPYLLLGAGVDYAACADKNSQDRNPGAVLTAGLGALLPLGSCYALNVGGDYVYRPNGVDLNHVQAKLGLQMRFGCLGGGQAMAQAADAAQGSATSAMQTVDLKGKGKAGAAASTSALTAGAQEGRIYIVKKGDSLWKIARLPEVLGQGHEFPKLRAVNTYTIPNADRIYPKQKLILP